MKKTVVNGGDTVVRMVVITMRRGDTDKLFSNLSLALPNMFLFVHSATPVTVAHVVSDGKIERYTRMDEDLKL
ncbi:hypothetical protein Tco_0307537 [Tanacetum coccineum]